MGRAQTFIWLILAVPSGGYLDELRRALRGFDVKAIRCALPGDWLSFAVPSGGYE